MANRRRYKAGPVVVPTPLARRGQPKPWAFWTCGRTEITSSSNCPVCSKGTGKGSKAGGKTAKSKGKGKGDGEEGKGKGSCPEAEDSQGTSQTQRASQKGGGKALAAGAEQAEPSPQAMEQLVACLTHFEADGPLKEQLARSLEMAQQKHKGDAEDRKQAPPPAIRLKRAEADNGIR